MLKDLSLKTILNNLTMGVAIADSERKIIYINDLTTKITGYDLDDFSTIDDVFEIVFSNQETRQKVQKDFIKNLDEKQYYNKVIDLKTKNGKQKYIEVRVNTIEDNKEFPHFLK